MARTEPKTEQCPFCNGTGDAYASRIPTRKCEACDGTGKVGPSGPWSPEDAEELRNKIDRLTEAKPETGEQWAEICRLEALMVSLQPVVDVVDGMFAKLAHSQS